MIDKYCAECTAAVTLCQSRICPMIKFVRDTAYTDALSCIAECFGTGYEQYVMVSVMGYGWLVGRMERFALVLTEVHGEIG